MFSTADAALPDDTFRTTAAARRPRVLPSRELRAPDLLRLTDAYAARALDGEFAFLYPSDGLLPADAPWKVLLFGDGDVDLWLVGWSPGVVTEPHDHGGSVAALTVVAGTLTEERWAPRREQLVLRAGDQAAFPAGVAHRVGNLDVEPAFSVHAYSPPLPEVRVVDEPAAVAGGARR